MADTNEISLADYSELIRTGRDGRQRYSEDYKQQVLEAFESSSMSGKAFAEQCGIKYPTFAAWLAKRRRKANTNEVGANTDTPAFLLAEIGEGSGALELILPGGATARVTTPGQARLLAALITALR